MMSIFGKILNKLGLKKDEQEQKAAPKAVRQAVKKPAPPKVDVRKVTGTFTAKKDFSAAKQSVAAKSKAAEKKVAAMSMVDVTAKLDAMAQGTGLNWKQSIADLLAVLGIDHGLAARKELAVELGCPPEFIGGNYSKMNIWLHKTVLRKIAENGGNIPQDLLD